MKKKILITYIILFVLSHVGFCQAIKDYKKSATTNKATAFAGPNTSLFGSISGGISNPQFPNRFPVSMRNYTLALYEVPDEPTEQLSKFILLGNRLVTMQEAMKEIRPDSFAYTITNIPLNKRFVILLEYKKRTSSTNNGDQLSFEESKFNVQGALFFCNKFAKSDMGNIKICRSPHYDLLNDIIISKGLDRND